MYVMLYNGKWQQINKENKQGEEMQKRKPARSKNELFNRSHITFIYIYIFFILSNIFDLQPQLFVQELTLFFVLATFLSQPKEAEWSSSTIVAGQTYGM
jgi:hypothetical protein